MKMTENDSTVDALHMRRVMGRCVVRCSDMDDDDDDDDDLDSDDGGDDDDDDDDDDDEDDQPAGGMAHHDDPCHHYPSVYAAAVPAGWPQRGWSLMAAMLGA